MIFRNKMLKKYTKWMPLGHYNHGGNDVIVMARQNIRTGMLQFRSKTMNRGMSVNSFFPNGIINVGEQWNKITKP